MSKKQRPDYYKILGLTVKASAKDIEAAALKMLHKYSPENYHGGDANARCEEIIEARDILLDENKRSEYDHYWLDTYLVVEEDNEKLAPSPLSEEMNTKETKTISNDNKFFKFCRRLQLREKNVDKEYPFLFKIYNWKTDGMIFFVTGVLIPLITIIILAFAANMGQQYRGWTEFAPKLHTSDGDDLSPMIFLGVNLLSNIVGFTLFWMRDKQVFVKSGLIIFYEYLFILTIVSFIASLILGTGAIKVSGQKWVYDPTITDGERPGYKHVNNTISDMPAFMLASIWFQIVGEIIVLVLAFDKTKDLLKRVIKTLKEDWKTVVMVALESGAVLFLVINYMMPSIFSGVPAMSLQSNNESSLESTISSPDKGMQVGYLITLFILTILIAPLTEELVARLAVFTGTSNLTLALFVASLFFAMLHVESGDVEHILNYFVGGLVLSSVFSMSRGNVVYDTGAHMMANLLSFVTICFTTIR